MNTDRCLQDLSFMGVYSLTWRLTRSVKRASAMALSRLPRSQYSMMILHNRHSHA